MSVVLIRRALEKHLQALDDFPTAWENVEFSPEEWPYQEVFTFFARPETPTKDADFYRQRGYMQIKLKFPLNTGPGAAEARGQALREHFQRGLSLNADGLITHIEEPPEVSDGAREGDRWNVNVFIRFRADVYTTKPEALEGVWVEETW